MTPNSNIEISIHTPRFTFRSTFKNRNFRERLLHAPIKITHTHNHVTTASSTAHGPNAQLNL